MSTALETEVDESQAQERCLTRNELALRWAVTTRTIANLEERGAIKGIRIGGILRYRMSDILAAEQKA